MYNKTITIKMGTKMFRLFLKTIMISVISCVLMTGELVSFADTTGTMTKGTDGVYQKTNTYDMKSTESDGAMSIITMLAIGALAAKMLTYKKWSLDMSIAAAAGAAYVIGEIMNIMNAKDELGAITATATLRADGATDSTQVEYLKKLRESYETVKSALEKKKSLQTLALYAFLAASAVAMYQKYQQESLANACLGAINTAITAAPGACTAKGGVTGTASALCVANLQTLGLSVRSFATFKDQLAATNVKEPASVPQETGIVAQSNIPCACAPEVTKAVGTACTTFIEHHQLTAAYGQFTIAFNDKSQIDKNLYSAITNAQSSKTFDQNKLKKILIKLSQYLISNSYAGYLGIGSVLVGAALLTFETTQAVLGKYIDTMLFTPGLRIMAWGAMTLFTKLAIGATEEKIKNAEDNIAKIDKVLNQMSLLSKGIQSSSGTVSTIALNTAALGGSSTNLSSTSTTSCVAGSSSSSSSSCKSLTSTVSTLSDFSTLPSALQTLTTQVTGASDSLSGKSSLSASALSTAANLGSKSNALGKLVSNQQDQLNKLITSKGQAPIDFAGDARKVANTMNAITSKALGSKGTNTSAMLSSLGMSSSSIPTLDSVAKKELTAAVAPTTKAGTAAAAASSKGMEFKFEDGAGNNTGLGNAITGKEASEKYDMSGTDISKTGISIFEIISTRYMKSAFPKLLEEDNKKN
jgi:hypothetical protein